MEPPQAPTKPARARTLADLNGHTPVHVVWEITLACNLKCSHCGSRAGKRRANELSTDEALSVIDQLAALGTREITLIGGEAFLRPDWIQLVRHIAGHGIRVGMQTGAHNLQRDRLEAAKQAGLFGIGVSLDGMRELHDRVRGVAGAWDDGLRAMETAKALGMGVSCNTQIGAETMPSWNRCSTGSLRPAPPTGSCRSPWRWGTRWRTTTCCYSPTGSWSSCPC
jgi:MoaA/NifB/PqqE/SkfB family radical SAM enzyme